MKDLGTNVKRKFAYVSSPIFYVMAAHRIVTCLLIARFDTTELPW